MTVSEGAGNAVFTVSINRNPQRNDDFSVQVATQNGTAMAGQDYTATSATLTFIKGGPTSQSFIVPIIDDTAQEATESFDVVLSNAQNGGIADGTGVGTILDNDQPPPPQACNIAVAPTSLAFGNVNVGSSTTQSTTVSNSGTAICNVTLAKTGSNDFTVTSPTNFSVASGGSQSVSVSYSPGQVGADTGNLAVNSDDPGTPTVDVGLSGNGSQQQAQCNPANLNTSINSTSQIGCPDTTLPQQAQVANNSYSVLAINDLGMHCGDLDTRISSILPPFQVLLAQVIQKGAAPTLNPAGVSVYYSAVSNPNDPILGSNVFDGVMVNGDTYKTNFWDTVINKKVYNAFYPFDIDGFMTKDRGLPVPNLEDLYISNGSIIPYNTANIVASQHDMPGITAPYSANAPKQAKEYYNDKPFFVSFPFGYVAENVNWFEGAGIPFSAFDDNGRENAYPLVRVEARQGNTTVSTVDTVLPISGEASCVNCHALTADYERVHSGTTRTQEPITALGSLPVADSFDVDPLYGNLPPRVSLEYAADINILRLHDKKHGPDYVKPTADGVASSDPCIIPDTDPSNPNPENGSSSCLINKALVQGQPVVCQVCHYTPALDLAHVGPKTGPAGTTDANGRNQLSHSSNSNVMHQHHAGTGLFPAIPLPTQNSNGSITNQSTRLTALENSCYQCHPGTNVKCLRGAMFNGGMLCSDCHGTMEQVGADFSQNVSPINPGAFVLDQGNFYDPNSPQPRTPWANEPGCGSCHTGDANSSIAGTTGTVTNTVDTYGNTDGIRLRVAYLVNNQGTASADAKATPIVPSDKRFAEPAVPTDFNGTPNNGAGNPQLYRVSTGHGGVMCEGCHGATHAEWPNANPNSNDNTTAKQLQGHTGVIAECSTCHGTAMDNSLTVDNVSVINGPHGMHPVGNTLFARGGHESVNRTGCADCHGPGRSGNTGTVLSVAKADRTITWTHDGQTHTVNFNKGEPVGCSACHSGGGG